MRSIAVIGVGAVGSAIANAIISLNITPRLLLFDIHESRCSGEVLDLSDTMGFFLTTHIVRAQYEDIRQADIIIISAGRPQKPGESRLELLTTNKNILDDILSNLTGLRKDAIVIIVTNPLDILTYSALRHLDLPYGQIFGTGTYIDSQRLQHLLARKLSVSSQSIETYVLGEHGDSQVIAWSATRIAGNSVERFGIDFRQQLDFAQQVKRIAHDIIFAKGATYFGIAATVAQLCKMIFYNTRQVIPLSWYHEEYGVCMSLPVILTETGIEKAIQLELTKTESDNLHKSAELLREYLKKN